MKVINPIESFMEASRSELISKSRSDDKERYNKRLNYRPVTFEGVNIRELFTNDDLIFTTNVGMYTDTLAVKGVLSELKSRLVGKSKCTYADVLKAINSCLDKDGIRIACTCPDFCLTGDTKISLLDGRELPIYDIVDEFNQGRDLWVYSTDEKGDFKPGRITDAWLTGTSDNVYEVTLDNGEVIKCTGNHPFMLRDGSYKNAEDLEVGQSLMPLYRRIGAKGYEQVRLNSSPTKSDYKSVYKLVAEEVYSSEIIRVSEFESRDGAVAIHHKDFNKSNNSPENLQIMGRLEHWDYHASLVKQMIETDPTYYKRTLGKGHDYWRTDEGRARKSKEMSESISKWWSSLSDEERSAHSKKCWESIDKEAWRTSLSAGRQAFFESMTSEERSQYTRKSINSPEAITKAAITRSATMKHQYASGERTINPKFLESTKGPRTQKFKDACSRRMSSIGSEAQSHRAKLGFKNRVKKVLVEMAESKVDLTPEAYSRYPQKGRSVRWQSHFDTWDDAVSYAGLSEYNHKVVSVVKLNDSFEVYDITVDKWHNFRLTAGVVVSNTYRYKYWAYKGGYLYGDPGKAVDAPKYDKTNKEGRGSFCKHLASLLTNKIWIVKVAAAINNYIRLHKEETYPYLDMTVPRGNKKVDVPTDEPKKELPVDMPTDEPKKELPIDEPIDEPTDEPKKELPVDEPTDDTEETDDTEKEGEEGSSSPS